jgi:hypothetical protein
MKPIVTHSRNINTTRKAIKDKGIEKMLKMAFWDRTVPPKKWKRAILAGDPAPFRNVVIPSFKYLPTRWLLDQIGDEGFIRRWPLVRSLLHDSQDPIAMQRLETWDAIWGILSVGDSQYPVIPEIVSLGRKKLGLLRIIVSHGACSTYSLYKISGRDYSRIYKDVQDLVERGLVTVHQKKTAKNRAVNILRAMFSVNSVLAASCHSIHT